MHDPCYLGRHNEIYDAPRELIAAIPGSEPKELSRNRRTACAAVVAAEEYGWKPRPASASLSLRIAEALDAGAKTLVTSCPYCITMLEDSCNVMGKSEELKVMDLSELISEKIG